MVLTKIRKPSINTRKEDQMMTRILHLKHMKQGYKTGKGIFIGDSAATSHMTSDPTRLYNVEEISGSVIIGNGQNIRCTHEGLFDVVCIQITGSTARDTWEIKLVLLPP